MHIEETSKKKPLIVITELPYQTNKVWWLILAHREVCVRMLIDILYSLQAGLVEQIAKLVDEGKITGVSDIRDESDRSGMRVVIELKKGKSY